VARQRTLRSLDFARRFRVVRDRWSNAQIFPLDIFPWLAIAATTLFLSPSWPRQIISIFRRKKASPVIETGTLPPRQTALAFARA